MARINLGKFEGDEYIKEVVFSKAVLWSQRKLSLQMRIMDDVKKKHIKKIVFIDKIKGEKWVFSVKKVIDKMRLESHGQEKQYYFPIDIKSETVDLNKPEPEAKPEQANLL